ncbi:molybdenum ABC transporter ATP-binding protein [Ruegeria halocynthiae]|uniref:molybdenum ABC transporter ATP-binding protein n=1 Tax=Ruegeria halocynthiae TaxID=985054 RepID=UPI00055B0529|nr:molybdenum ABC transporter ATP-binding protein [Ruegeria halocynthiae]
MSLSVRLQHDLPDIKLDLSFDAPPGVTVLFGRSGSGKTTVVNAVAGLLRPKAGRVAIDGWQLFDTDQNHWLPPHRRRLGYIFQEGRLFPHLTVRQNLLYGRWFAPRGARREDPDKVIEMLGVGHLLDRRPTGLSGGEKQRVAIGRALLASPRLILADEPLAALDDARKAEILPYFERLRDEVSVPILYVTHSAAEVARLATSVVALQDGKVVRHGPASDVMADPSVAPAGVRAIGAVLQVRVTEHHADGLTELDAGGARLFLPRIQHRVGEGLRIRIPAQEVILSTKQPEGLSALNVLEGVVDTIRAGEGPGAIVSVKTPAGSILARVTRRSVAALGLAQGRPCFAVIKTVALAPQDVGGRLNAP